MHLIGHLHLVFLSINILGKIKECHVQNMEINIKLRLKVHPVLVLRISHPLLTQNVPRDCYLSHQVKKKMKIQMP